MAVATNVRLHETSSWHLDFSDRRSSHKRETPRDKLVASRFQRPAGVAASVRLHETSSWRPEADINSICVADKANSSPHDQCAQGRLSSRMSLGNIDLH